VIANEEDITSPPLCTEEVILQISVGIEESEQVGENETSYKIHEGLNVEISCRSKLPVELRFFGLLVR
jgi:hypothetical protein